MKRSFPFWKKDLDLEEDWFNIYPRNFSLKEKDFFFFLNIHVFETLLVYLSLILWWKRNSFSTPYSVFQYLWWITVKNIEENIYEKRVVLEVFEIFTMTVGWITINKMYVGSHSDTEVISLKKKRLKTKKPSWTSAKKGWETVCLSHRWNNWEFILSGEICPIWSPQYYIFFI